MPTCRCTCAAYNGSCACRHDGLTQGRQRGYDEAIADVVRWLRQRPLGVVDGAFYNEAADEIESGDWKK